MVNKYEEQVDYIGNTNDKLNRSSKLSNNRKNSRMSKGRGSVNTETAGA